MPTITLHINGLTHHDIAGHRESFLQHAAGRRMVLRAAPCRQDERAVAAYVGVELVGYVARTDLDLAWAAMNGMCSEVLRGEVESTGTHSVVFSCFVERLDACSKADTTATQDWCYTRPLLPVLEQWQRLDYLSAEMEALLREEADACEILELFDAFCRLACFDVSREMLVFRRRLRDMLRESDNPLLSDCAERVEELSQRMGGDHVMDRVGTWMRHELPYGEEAGTMLRQSPRTLRRPTVEAQASLLPMGLWEEWCSSPAQFAKVLYGLRLPREEVRRVLSCLIWLERVPAQADDGMLVQAREMVDKTMAMNDTSRADMMEVVLSRWNDANGHSIQPELDRLRAWIDERKGRAAVEIREVAQLFDVGGDMKLITNGLPAPDKK